MKLLSLHPVAHHLLGRVAGPRLGLLADSVNDANSTRKVYLLAAGLAVLGIALVAITVWFWRSTRHDPELLAPLEVIGGRRFRRLEGDAQQAVLDDARPVTATPMQWGVRRGEASGEPQIDLRASLRSAPAGYEDLHDPALIAVALAESVEKGSELDDPIELPTTSTDDIDSALAAVGAKVDLPEGAVVSSPESSDSAAASAASVSVSASADVPAALPSSDADAPEAEAPAVVVVATAAEAPRGSKPGGNSAVGQPLVIVPVDHEVRPSAVVPVADEPKRRIVLGGPREPEPADATAAEELPDEGDSAAIDPLLRMFNRHDG
jgi:hypothetical protein